MKHCTCSIVSTANINGALIIILVNIRVCTAPHVAYASIELEMEKCLASVDFSEFGHDKSLDRGVVIDDNDSGSESCEETRKMVLKQNRKGKKSGGFQSMGKCVSVRLQEVNIIYSVLISGLSYAVFSAVMKKGYRVPTPIQRKVRNFGSHNDRLSITIFMLCNK